MQKRLLKRKISASISLLPCILPDPSFGSVAMTDPSRSEHYPCPTSKHSCSTWLLHHTSCLISGEAHTRASIHEIEDHYVDLSGHVHKLPLSFPYNLMSIPSLKEFLKNGKHFLNESLSRTNLKNQVPPCSENFGLLRICLANFNPFLYCFCS